MHALYLYLIVAQVALAHSSDKKIVWTSPSSTDRYRSGDQLSAIWSVGDSKESASPLFRLCDRSDSCGTAVWPGVESLDDGLYKAVVRLPNVTSEATYHLQMEHESGKPSSSPEFALSPLVDNNDSAQKHGESPAAAPQDGSGAQMPLSMPSTDSPSLPASDAPAKTMSSADSYATPSYPTLPSQTARPVNLASRANMPSVIALAVPLSLAGIILIVAIALFIRHRVKRSRNRTKLVAELHVPVTEKAARRSTSPLVENPFTLNTHGDAEKGVIPSALLTGNLKGLRIPFRPQARTAPTAARDAEGPWRPTIQVRESLSDSTDAYGHPEHGDALGRSFHLPSMRFDEIALSPRIPPPLHVRNSS